MTNHYLPLNYAIALALFSAAFSMIFYTFLLYLIRSDKFRIFLNRTFHTKLTSPSPILNKKIFIVHGHNHEKKLETHQLLTRLGLVPIILHEVANGGRTIIEKFEHSSNVGYAVILLTDDDIGRALTEEQFNKRARQNVVLELGYFFGKLGRNKVCALVVDGVEIPTDLSGLLHIRLDKSGAWKSLLANELKFAGFDVDMNDLYPSAANVPVLS
jgi:predicted nucleotide-binding protein